MTCRNGFWEFNQRVSKYLVPGILTFLTATNGHHGIKQANGFSGISNVLQYASHRLDKQPSPVSGFLVDKTSALILCDCNTTVL